VDNKNYNNYKNQGGYPPRQNNPYGGGYNQDAEMKQVVEKLVGCVKNLNENNVKDFVENAENFAKYNLNEVGKSKMRNFYDEIVRIFGTSENQDKAHYNSIFKQLYLIKPKIAYAIGKETKPKAKEHLENFEGLYSKLMDALDESLKKNDEKNIGNIKDVFDNFKKLMEAIIAYHKIYAKGE